jgi:hypothetical protein
LQDPVVKRGGAIDEFSVHDGHGPSIEADV